MRKKIKSMIIIATCLMLCGEVINYNTEIAYGKMTEDFESESCGAYNGFLYVFLNPEKTEVEVGAFTGEYHGMIDYPREIKGAKVTSIMYGLNPHGVTEINITDNITLIKATAFKWCKIETLLIPKTVKYIKEYAFDCPTLKKVTIFKETKLENRALSRANSDLLVYGEAGSETEREAKFTGLEFIPIDGEGKEVPKTIADNELVIPKDIEKVESLAVKPTSKLSKVTIYKETDVDISAFENSPADMVVYGEIGSSTEKAAKKGFKPRNFIPINANGEVIGPIIEPTTDTVQTPSTTPDDEYIPPVGEDTSEEVSSSSTPNPDETTSTPTDIVITDDKRSVLTKVLLFVTLGAFGLVGAKKKI